ncbi:MAG: FHA domain-containing protein [Armatimonadetes bacterium]|nr:FHA domain-containing protein [Armatimonadota bacterium]
MRSRIVVGTLLGAIGGFLGFALQERLITHDAVLTPLVSDMMRLGAMVGAMLGIAIGSVEGVVVGSANRLARGAILGGMIGVVGGMFGMYVGGFVYTMALFGKDAFLLDQSRNLLDFTHSVLARALGWTFLGAFPGLAAGAATMSQKRTMHGLAGGLIGGFLGGFAFNLVANLFAQPIQGMAAAASSGPQIIEIGGPSRAVGFTAIGAFTGLFIGLVDELLKQAWVRVLVGTNEGKDFIISKSLTIIGRDERADIPVFADPSLTAQHAAIRIDQNRHVLHDGGSPVGSMVNGQRVKQAVLRDGDMIQLGQVRLLFREKATASRAPSPARDVARAPQAAGRLQMPANLCQFCGAPKDAQGACLCSVGGVAVPGPTQAPATAVGPGLAGGQPSPGLTVIEGPDSGASFELHPLPQTLGRETGRTIMLADDMSVSRRHARIEDQMGTIVIVDEGSANGTFVNGVRITSQALAPGDVIQVGTTRLMVQ